MKNKLFTFIILFFAFKSVAQVDGNSQANVKTLPEDIDWANLNLEDLVSESAWKFHIDKSSNVLYVDFAELGGNLSKLILKNHENEVLLIDDRLFELPSDAIYEINLNKYLKGNYVLELYTHESVIKEGIIVQ
jgi:hypothetical protein